MSKKLWRVGAEELKYVQQALEGGLTGEFTKIFEARFAETFGVEYAVAVNSGTSALHAAMAALDVGPGDEVIVPPLTFIATAFAPLFVGAVPVFADVDPYTFNIDPGDIRKKITTKTNNAGGIHGGISNGSDIILRMVVKPTSSILKSQDTVTTSKKKSKIRVE